MPIRVPGVHRLGRGSLVGARRVRVSTQAKCARCFHVDAVRPVSLPRSQLEGSRGVNERGKRHKFPKYNNLWRACQKERRGRDSIGPISANCAPSFVCVLNRVMTGSSAVSLMCCSCTVFYCLVMRFEGSLRAGVATSEEPWRSPAVRRSVLLVGLRQPEDIRRGVRPVPRCASAASPG